MRALAEPDLRADAFKSPGSWAKEGRDIAAWLLRASLARYVVAAFLSLRTEGQDLRGYVRDRVIEKAGMNLRPSESANLVQAMADLRDGVLSEIPFASVQFLCSRMIRKRISPLPREPEEVGEHPAGVG